MAPTEIILPTPDYAGTQASEAHFGANVLMTMNYLDAGGTFDRLLQQMGAVNLRFPGGTVAEDLAVKYGDRLWDVDHPSGISTTGESRLTTYPAFMDYANQHNVEAMLVIPTEPFLEEGAYGERDVASWGLYRVMTHTAMLVDQFYGDARINTMSIGNEFWYNNDRMTAEEYGNLASEVAKGLQYVFDRHTADMLAKGVVWDDPDISVQAALGADIADNQALIDQLDMEARAAIDTVETHFYPRQYSRIDDFDKLFDRVHDFQNAPGFGHLKTYVSEWNIKSDTTTDLGLLQGAGMIEMMDVMLREGVDAATIWGLQYTQLSTRMSTLIRDPSSPSGHGYQLTGAGEVFHWMSEAIPGTQVMDLSAVNDTGTVEGHAFGNADHVSIFVSSMNGDQQDIVLNIHNLVPNYTHFWGQQLGVIDDPSTPANEADPLDPGNHPVVETIDRSAIDADGNIHLHLDPYEIANLNFQLNGEGVHMYGQLTNSLASELNNDHFNGSAGSDRIEGNVGDDVVRGLDGNDSIYGGSGNDYLNGGCGNDIVDAGTGHDTLFGHTGNDTLVAAHGDATLTGGTGVDQFVVATDANTIITDFGDITGQTLSFLDHYSSLDDVLGRITTEGNDLLISHDDGYSTRLEGMAGHMDALTGGLADFMDQSPVQDIVDQLNAPVPDGSVAPDPEPGSHPDLLNEADIEYAQNILKMDPGQLNALAASFTKEGFDEFLGRIDPDTFFYCMRPEELAAFMNGLDDGLREKLLGDVSSDGIAFKLLRLHDDVGSFLSQLGADPLVDLIRLVDHQDADVISPRISASTRHLLQDRVDTIIGQDSASPLAHFFAEDDAQPDPEPDPDPAPEQDPVGSSGCFVATAAYCDRRHPDVEYLRLVRDMILINHGWGRLFIKIYWKIGPKLARFVAPRPALRRISVTILHALITRLQRRRVLQRHGTLPMQRLRQQR